MLFKPKQMAHIPRINQSYRDCSRNQAHDLVFFFSYFFVIYQRSIGPNLSRKMRQNKARDNVTAGVSIIKIG
jgi:hypothetical protein